MHRNTILSNGISMPRIGYGVFRITDQRECTEAVLNALKAGYRLIDTAAAYGNEQAVGQAIRQSNIPRSELFISTKLWITDTSYERAKKGLQQSMEQLGLDYIDLYVIHQPYNDYYGAWRALEELYDAGRIRAIGVDNFAQDRLADFMFWNKQKPMVNFLECNPFFQRDDEQQYLNSYNIQMLAWSPLSAGQNDIFHNEQLCELAQKHQKSAAQIILRWLIQRNIVPIVKSANPERMKENLNIFDFQLAESEMACISKLDTGHSCFTARSTGKAVENFLNQAVTEFAPTNAYK